MCESPYFGVNGYILGEMITNWGVNDDLRGMFTFEGIPCMLNPPKNLGIGQTPSWQYGRILKAAIGATLPSEMNPRSTLN